MLLKSLLYTFDDSSFREAAKKITVFFGKPFPNLFTHPPTQRVFVRFGKTKGEIWVKKGNFRGVALDELT